MGLLYLGVSLQTMLHYYINVMLFVKHIVIKTRVSTIGIEKMMKLTNCACVESMQIYESVWSLCKLLHSTQHLNLSPAYSSQYITNLIKRTVQVNLGKLCYAVCMDCNR